MASFHIKHPPRNVISWITLLAEALTLPTALPKPLQPSSLTTGIGGAHSLNIQESQTNSWGGGPTRAEDNPCVIICRLSVMKPVRHNQETNNPQRNCQVRHIRCICILPDAHSERPGPKVLRSNILNLVKTTKGLQNAGPNN